MKQVRGPRDLPAGRPPAEVCAPHRRQNVQGLQLEGRVVLPAGGASVGPGGSTTAHQRPGWATRGLGPPVLPDSLWFWADVCVHCRKAAQVGSGAGPRTGARAHLKLLVQFAVRCGQAGEEWAGRPRDRVDMPQTAGCTAGLATLSSTSSGQKSLPTRKVCDRKGGRKISRNRDLGKADGSGRRRQAGKEVCG